MDTRISASFPESFFRVLSVAVLVLVAGPGNVRAATMEVSALLDSSGDSSVLLPQFNPAVGRLAQADLHFTGDCFFWGEGYNSLSEPAYYYGSFEAIAAVEVSGLSLRAAGDEIGFVDGLFAASSPVTFRGSIPVSGSAVTSLAADLEALTGTGFVSVGYGGMAMGSSGPPPGLDGFAAGGGLNSGEVRLTYYYELVPEPSALTLLAGGLVLVVNRRRGAGCGR